MTEESQAQLQRMVKQKEREAVCAYLAKSGYEFDKKFLSKLLVLDNDDDYDLYLRECLDGHFYLEFKKTRGSPATVGTYWDNSDSTILYANMFAAPHLIAFMRLCSATEPMNPAACAVFVTARLFEIAKKHSKDEKLLFGLEMQRNHTATMVDCKAHTDERHIGLIDDLLTGYIKKFLL